MGFKIKFKNLLRAAGSSRYGGGAAEAAPTTPPRVPLAPPPASPTSPPPLQAPRPPPRPPGKDTDEGPDDEDWQEVADDEDDGPDDENSQEVADDERKNWKQLLDGKRTYLRPPREHHVVSDVFKCPDTRKAALGRQKRLSRLVEKHSKNFFKEKIKILCQHYAHFRRTRGDGSCFYRAFLFSYLENLGLMQDSQAEVTRLMEHVAMSRENFCRLKWDKAYFLNPEEYFSSVFSEFSHLVNSVANGLSSDELYNRSIQEIVPLRIISLLRLLAETEIRSQEDDFKSLLPKEMDALTQYCCKELRPLDVEAEVLPMRALTYALGIPLRVETVGEGSNRGIQVERLDLFPRSESGKGPLHLVQSYWSSITTPEPHEIGSGNLLSSDGTPLLTLLCRPRHCDILYRSEQN
ncbi:OVARIAN TUMOR DOMAIN-containing deubiquitinating enzyme 1 isoform X1 [Triticum aestivum]|uniref:OVARIAN TUMOR DOMAIN-containing deubiquitinating enzyme 1 isoform X1 n=1 Tax=Triticum aestivum TaxID=4565 RepID=UPI001D02CB6B|nr:OVARIAN TUMOR DOMAIN-containing deubiquitinating enzyme 1-like isoform X1 [Triticum aestivum]